MPTVRNSAAFAGIVSALLERGSVVRFRANGCSMGAAIRDGEVVYIEPFTAGESPANKSTANPGLQPLQVAGHDFSRAAETSQNRALAPELGDILLTRSTAGFKAHRLVANDRNLYITQGDSVQNEDTPVRAEQIFGRVIAVESHSKAIYFARTLVGIIRGVLSKLLNTKALPAGR